MPKIAGTLEIIAWKAARDWSQWHLARDGQPLCQVLIPITAARCEASRRSGPLLLESLCRRCLLAYANEDLEV